MCPPIFRAILVVLVLSVSMTSTAFAGTAGNAEARKLIVTAMEIDFLASKYDAADDKLTKAEAICKRKGCSPDMHASIYGYFAIIDWVADQDQATAIDDLKLMLKIDPEQKLDKQYAPDEMLPLLKKARAKLGLAASREKSSARETEEAMPPEPEERAPAPRVSNDRARSAAEARMQAARQAAEERREAARLAAEEARAAAEERRDAQRRGAEEKKEAQRRAAEELRRAAAELKEAARREAEEKKEAARREAEEKKEAARLAAEEARQAAEERKEAARIAAEEKKEAARKAAEEKKEAARKAAEDARIAAEEKKEAARKAAEERKAEAARKAEEARLAEIDKRLRKPPPVGTLLEEPWKGQAIDYPVLVRVKLPPPPARIEPERVTVVKVVTEYSGPGLATPAKIELKPTKEGEYEGRLPCEVTKQEGEVTYYTTAYNQYENAVATSGSITKPHRVQIKAELASSLSHMPGELPPESCTESERLAKAAPASQPKCAESGDCARGPVCEGADCGQVVAAPDLAVPKRGGRGCAGCAIDSAAHTDWKAIVGFGLALACVARRRGAYGTVMGAKTTRPFSS